MSDRREPMQPDPAHSHSHSHSEVDVLDLIDRAASGAPAMHVPAGDVVTGGRRKVRRRRATGAGMGLAALALAGALWFGPGQGLLGSSSQLAPAGSDPGTSAARTALTGTGLDDTLTLAGGETLTLTVVGEDLVATGVDGGSYPTPLAEIWGVKGLWTTLGQDSRPVVYIGGWQLADPALARIGGRSSPEGTVTWQEPADVAGVMVGEGGDATQVVAVKPQEEPPASELVVGELQPDGSILEVPLTVRSPFDGVALQVDPGTGEPSALLHDGTELAPAPQRPEGPLWTWLDTDGSTIVVGEASDTGQFVPVVERDGRVVAAPEALGDVGETQAGGRTFVLARVDTEDPVVALVREDSDQRTEGVANYWHFVGEEPLANVAVEEGLVVATRSGLWLLAQTNGRMLHEPQVGRVDEDVLTFGADERTLHFAGVVNPSGPVGVVTAPSSAEGDTTFEETELDDGSVLVHGTVRELGTPDPANPADVGLDLDRDGEVDVPATRHTP